jgi:hypothetical protein
MHRPSFAARLYGGALIGLVVAFSVTSLVAMAFKQAEISRAENRALAQLPELPRTLAQWETFPQRFDAYFDDNFGLRKLLLRLNSTVNAALLGRSPSNKVIFGQDKWLFYAGEESIELYRNQRPLSSLQLSEAREALALRVRGTAELNARYLFVVVPDKHTIYPEKMPSFMPRRDQPSQLDQVLAVAEAARLPMLDLRPALRRGKADGLVYLKDDTHWTDWGAYLGYRAIVAALPGNLPVLDLQPSQFSVPSEFAGGLAGMANLPWVEPMVTSSTAADRCAIATTSLGQVAEGVSVIRSTCAKATGKAVYIGDSFTERMIRYLSQSFGEVVYVIRSGFSPWRDIRPYVEKEAPDVVIEELVERHLDSTADSLAKERAAPR